MDRTEKRCGSCGKSFPASGFYKNRGRYDGLTGNCRVCHTAKARDTGPVSVRLAVLKELGGKCVRCGFDDPRALQIDHVNSDGKEHRISVRTGLYANPLRYYKSMLAAVGGNKFELQVLCSNCSFIKMEEADERRHLDRRTYEPMPEPLPYDSPNLQRKDYADKRQEARDLAARLGMKVCSKCKTSKSLGAFYKDKKRPDGLYPYCKDCHTTSIADSKARRAIA
jgi:hypothetical protein